MKAATSMTARPYKRRYLRIASAAILFVVVCCAGIAWWMGGWLLAPAQHAIGLPPSDLPCESFSLQSESGATIAGWHIRASGHEGVVVLLHAIRGSRVEMIDRARLFRNAGYSVVMIDLQAHGESTGDQITLGFRERFDARAAVEFAKAQHPDEPIAVVGQSLGGAAAVLASPLGIDAVVLESVYPTIEEAINNRVHARLRLLSPIAARALLMQLWPRLGISADELRPIDKIEAIGCPMLILAGSDDWHTTLEQAQRMFAYAKEPKFLTVFQGAAHTNLESFDPSQYAQVTLEFLAQYMLTKNSQPAINDTLPTTSEP